MERSIAAAEEDRHCRAAVVDDRDVELAIAIEIGDRNCQWIAARRIADSGREQLSAGNNEALIHIRRGRIGPIPRLRRTNAAGAGGDQRHRVGAERTHRRGER